MRNNNTFKKALCLMANLYSHENRVMRISFGRALKTSTDRNDNFEYLKSYILNNENTQVFTDEVKTRLIQEIDSYLKDPELYIEEFNEYINSSSEEKDEDYEKPSRRFSDEEIQNAIFNHRDEIVFHLTRFYLKETNLDRIFSKEKEVYEYCLKNLIRKVMDINTVDAKLIAQFREALEIIEFRNHAFETFDTVSDPKYKKGFIEDTGVYNFMDFPNFKSKDYENLEVTPDGIQSFLTLSAIISGGSKFEFDNLLDSCSIMSDPNYPHRIILSLYGTGGEGKSAWYNAVMSAMKGQNYRAGRFNNSNLGVSTLGISEGVKNLFNIYENDLKKYTSGEELITFENKFQTPVQLPQSSNFMITSNYFHGYYDSAMERRLAQFAASPFIKIITEQSKNKGDTTFKSLEGLFAQKEEWSRDFAQIMREYETPRQFIPFSPFLNFSRNSFIREINTLNWWTSPECQKTSGIFDFENYFEALSRSKGTGPFTIFNNSELNLAERENTMELVITHVRKLMKICNVKSHWDKEREYNDIGRLISSKEILIIDENLEMAKNKIVNQLNSADDRKTKSCPNTCTLENIECQIGNIHFNLYENLKRIFQSDLEFINYELTLREGVITLKPSTAKFFGPSDSTKKSSTQDESQVEDQKEKNDVYNIYTSSEISSSTESTNTEKTENSISSNSEKTEKTQTCNTSIQEAKSLQYNRVPDPSDPSNPGRLISMLIATPGEIINEVQKMVMDLENEIQNPFDLPKDKAPLIKFAKTQPDLSFPMPRRAENLTEVEALILDYDSGMTQEEWVEKFGHYQFFSYSTKSSTTEKKKFRVILPLKRAVTEEEIKSVSEKLEKIFTGVDPASFHKAQFFYAPNRGEEYSYHSNLSGEVFELPKLTEREVKEKERLKAFRDLQQSWNKEKNEMHPISNEKSTKILLEMVEELNTTPKGERNKTGYFKIKRALSLGINPELIKEHFYQVTWADKKWKQDIRKNLRKGQ